MRIQRFRLKKSVVRNQDPVVGILDRFYLTCIGERARAMLRPSLTPPSSAQAARTSSLADMSELGLLTCEVVLLRLTPLYVAGWSVSSCASLLVRRACDLDGGCDLD
jgi:hypothetical protein